MRSLSEAIGRRLLLADAPIENQLIDGPIDPQRDLFGAEGCLAILSLTRASLVREAHEAQLRAGADILRTNTAEASPLELRRFGLGDDAFAINYGAARLAAEMVAETRERGRPSFALGMVRDLGWEASASEIEDAAALQASGLFAGGVDGIAIDTGSRRGRAPVFLKGAARARAEARSAAGIYLFSDRGAPEGNDRALRYLQISAEEVRANPDRLRGFNLIGGRGLEDTAALVELLREFATDGAEPYREAARKCSIRSYPIASP
jgi:methionine synthase I (cobalamin-dependent)